MIELPEDRVDVVGPPTSAPLKHPVAALRAALQNPIGSRPLRDLVMPGQRVVVAVCDVTRPQPRSLMLEAILTEIGHSVPAAEVTILVATGSHRANTPSELTDMLGSEVMRSCRVLCHDARDKSSLVYVGHADGAPVWLSREWCDADVRISTGFVEPHFFAGFSGGPKLVAPGLAGIATIMELHSASRIGSPLATWGICEGNPVHDSIRSAAALAPPKIACDVLLDRAHRIVDVFAGELFMMHKTARKRARALAMQAVPQPYEVVVTTNSGYPLDQNLYQSVKGLAAAEPIVCEGGTIILAAACSDGLPDDSSYATLLSRATSLEDLKATFASPAHPTPDQWQVQVQARVQSKASVRVFSTGLRHAQVRAAHMEPIDDIATAVCELLQELPATARVCVLPEGPQTLAFLSP